MFVINSIGDRLSIERKKEIVWASDQHDTLDSIAVSVFVVILVDFDKYWDDNQNIVAPAHEDP